MIISKLALRNLLGAGLRTWLNVIVLSFSFVTIIGLQGLYEGMGEQATQALLKAEYSGGQYWQENYDPYDPLTLQDAHGVLTKDLQNQVKGGQATPILVVQGNIYPEGRIRTVLLKGIDPAQTILSIPSSFLDVESEELPALIGNRMAKNTGLEVGDYVAIQWRDASGTFDALDARIVQVMKTSVPTIDNGIVWLPLEKLQELANLKNEATLVVVSSSMEQAPKAEGWSFKNLDYLLKNVKDLVRTKKVGGSIFYIVLMFLAMLAIFDTQVLSIFKRRKEMGTLMSLGLTRGKVIQLFTLEGALHAVLAALIGALYGIPLLGLLATKGWTLPQSMDSYGFAIGEKLFPVYSAGLVLSTTILVLFVTTVVSFLPTRKIAKLKPTDALRGQLS